MVPSPELYTLRKLEQGQLSARSFHSRAGCGLQIREAVSRDEVSLRSLGHVFWFEQCEKLRVNRAGRAILGRDSGSPHRIQTNTILYFCCDK